MYRFLSNVSSGFRLSVLFLSIALISGYPAGAQGGPAGGGISPQKTRSEGSGAADTVRAILGPNPDLADLIPAASRLSGRLKALEYAFASLPEVAQLETRIAAVESRLARPAGQFENYKTSGEYGYGRLLEIREEIRREGRNLEYAARPLNGAIRRLWTRRDEWAAEKRKWDQWRSAVKGYGEYEMLGSTFDKAAGIVEDALARINERLVPLLALQRKAGDVQEGITALTLDIDAVLEGRRRSTLMDSSPPMLSPEYRDQFEGGLWEALRNGLYEASWPGRRVFETFGRIILLQVVLSLLLIATIFRRRSSLRESARWGFAAERPVSSGIFFVGIAIMIVYGYSGAPAILKLINIAISAIAFLRLSLVFLDASWKKRLVAASIVLLVLTSFLEILGRPLPLLRIYTVLASLFGTGICLRSAADSRRTDAAAWYVHSFRAAALLFAFIAIADIWGAGTLPLYLLGSFVRTVTMTMVFVLFLHIIHGGIESALRKVSYRRSSSVEGIDSESVIRRTMNFVDFAACVLLLVPGILVIWGLYQNLGEATGGLLSLGFTMGSKRVSVGLILIAAAILYGTPLVSLIVQKTLMEGAFRRSGTEAGIRHSMTRLLHYFIAFFGFLIVVSILGVDITKITIILGALGVGIGFGLQGIVNNFVSGLILLFERPVRIGDFIEIDGKWSQIRRIGIRSTMVRTLDQADVIIPNADLIANQVTNWTLTDRQVRLIIPLGVRYGSDVKLVMEKLKVCAQANERISDSPSPRVLFLNFGDSALEFELHAWVRDADDRLVARSELHEEIDRVFREAGIVIAYPQLDLHLHDVDEGAVMRVKDPG